MPASQNTRMLRPNSRAWGTRRMQASATGNSQVRLPSSMASDSALDAIR